MINFIQAHLGKLLQATCTMYEHQGKFEKVYFLAKYTIKVQNLAIYITTKKYS